MDEFIELFNRSADNIAKMILHRTIVHNPEVYNQLKNSTDPKFTEVKDLLRKLGYDL